MSFRLVVANVHDDPVALRQALANAPGYALLNEVQERAVRALYALSALFGRWRSVQNAHVWKRSTIRRVPGPQRIRRLARGGRRGLADVPVSRRLKRRHRRKRLGPSRFAMAQLVYEVATGRMVIMVVTHLPARSQTVEKWRRYLMNRVVIPNLRKFLHSLEAAHPGVPIVFGGDVNLKDLDDLRLGHGWRVAKTPPDFGKRHYTQVHYAGPVSITDVGEFNTASDHDAISCTVTIGASAPVYEAA